MVKANEVGVKVAFIPLVYLITSVVPVLFTIPLGSLSDRIEKKKVLIEGLLYDKINSRVPFHSGAACTLTAGILMIIFLLNQKNLSL